MSVKVIDRMPIFAVTAMASLDNALRESARDGLIDAKTHAPYGITGNLRGDSYIQPRGLLKWRISFWTEYARFQEFGGDSKRTVRNYTTPGTGAHFLRNAGDKQAEKLNRTFKKHSGVIQL